MCSSFPHKSEQILFSVFRLCLDFCGKLLYIVEESGSFRPYSRSVRSFWPGSFRPDFLGESFRSSWGESFQPYFIGGSFRPDFGGESFRPDLFIFGKHVR